MKLQIGMHVKIRSSKSLGEDSGKTKKITANLPDYNGYRAYELDNEKNAIYLAEDFEYCIEYPNLPIE